jgi:hypothetical protein
MWSHHDVSANGRPPRALAEVELEELRARCRRQSEVIRTLGELVATYKTGTRALKADNLQLRAENNRLRGHPRAISGTIAPPADPLAARHDADAMELRAVRRQTPPRLRSARQSRRDQA